MDDSMTAQEWSDLISEQPAVDMIRPIWNFEEFHKKNNLLFDVTVLITHFEGKDVTQLCLESLLRFYPDIQILIINNSPNDRLSTNYLKLRELQNSNIRVWDRIGINSHGVSMDDAIQNHVNTNFVLLVDSDIVIMRGGFIELMLNDLITSKAYAVGTLLLGSNKNDAIGAPVDREDVLRYAHPSLSLYDRRVYGDLRPFCDHGAPCVYNMQDAKHKNLQVLYFPVDKYSLHLTGSWCKPKPIWMSDSDVTTRPFLTFILENGLVVDDLVRQTDKDFDMISVGDVTMESHVFQDGKSEFIHRELLYNIRFNVKGDYVCKIDPSILNIAETYIESAKQMVIDAKLPDHIDVGGIMLYERKYWQKNISIR